MKMKISHIIATTTPMVKKNVITASMLLLLLGISDYPAAAASLHEDKAVTHTQTAPITVAHIQIVSSLPFEDVRKNLEANLPKLDAAIIRALREGDHSRGADYEKEGPELSIFLEREHGLLLQIWGKPGKVVQYEIGNLATAVKMVRYHLAAALYAPLRVVLYANDEGKGVFEYNKPSSLFGQNGDAKILEVAYGLDAVIEKVLLKAATGEQSGQQTSKGK